MARPLVLVYQEFATVTVTPSTPDLNCLVTGPAYWIKDYLDDKGDIQTSTDYGTLEANNPYVAPAAATDEITVADPPGNKTGALLDETSVQVYLDEARVLIVEDADDADASTGGDVTANSNVLTATGGTPVNFVTSGVAAGDHLIIEDPAGGGTDLKLVVLAVDSATTLRTTKNFTTTATDLIFRIERKVSDVALDSSFVVITGNEIKVQGGATTILTGELTARTINYAEVYIEYRSLRQDLRALDTVSSETDIETKIGKVDARNPLAGVTKTALDNTTAPIQFFGVKSDDSTGHGECIEVIESRKDVYAIVPITVDKNIISLYNTNVTNLASVSYAETNGVAQKFRVVIGSLELPTTSVIDGPFTDGIHRAVSGAVSGTAITSADDPSVFVDTGATFVTDGVRAGDTLVIVTDTAVDSREGSYTVAEVYDENRLRITGTFGDPGTPNETSLIQGNVQYYVIRGTGTPVASTSFDQGDGAVGPPETISLKDSGGDLTGTAAMVGNVVRLTAPAPLAGDWLVVALNAAGPPGVLEVEHPTLAMTLETGTVAGSQFATVASVTTARQVSTRRPFRYITSATGEFSTNLVQAGDTLQVPNPITGTDYTTNAPYEYTVAYIPNENDIVLEANSDVIATDLESGDTTLKFRISRELTKDNQVTELIAIAQSFSSRRTVLVWPDSVDVADLVDGSKPRSLASVPEAADAQPGYYLAAVVGGMTSGLPSHQGFTNLGITGIDRIYNSTGYFSDLQMTQISDGGWFVFAQDTPNALPYSIHQLTTDADTLETGEYSMVKNFDFVSLFFADILRGFKGIYNINEETLGFLRQALTTGIDALKLRKFARIGAPINDASISSIAESSAASDRVEIYLNANFPAPLNTMGLHIISE